MKDLPKIRTIEEEIAKADNLTALDRVRVKYMGKKGIITGLISNIGKISSNKRVSVGQQLNELKHKAELSFKDKKAQLTDQLVVKTDYIDFTAPGIGLSFGHSHPVLELQQRLIEVFWQLGFKVAKGPEIETDWYNFEALNIPVGHPARDMQDTFYLTNGAIPRTHTSSVQIRYMEKHKPPIRIIALGNVYRNEDEDTSHLWVFKQIEGLVVDKGIGLSDLKGTLLYMFKSILGQDVKVRLRPNYFPYVEPALEVDASCVICKGSDVACRLCKGTGWLEMLGSGMVHPQVLKNVGIDPAIYSGFAFGGGIERLAAIKYQIEDIREFWRPNLKLLEQF